MSSRLSELVAFKELWEKRKEIAEGVIAHYEREITQEVKKSKDNIKEEN